MSTKQELYEEAKGKGLKVTTKTKKSELEELLGNGNNNKDIPNEKPGAEPVVTVNENEDGEATSGTTKEGDESPVKNTESIPQNGKTDVEILEVTDNEIAKKADAARTEEQFKFADESNPNQKGRYEGAPTEYDQDGNLRTGGKSYGVSANNPENETPQENAGEKPEENNERVAGERVYSDSTDQVNADQLHAEKSPEEVEKLEEQLSVPDKNIAARVITSAGNYLRVKFFQNNKPLGTFKSRSFDTKGAKKFRDDVAKEQE